MPKKPLILADTDDLRRRLLVGSALAAGSLLLPGALRRAQAQSPLVVGQVRGCVAAGVFVVSVTKGFELETLERMSTVLEDLLTSATSGFHDALRPVDLERAVVAGDSESERGTQFKQSQHKGRAVADSAR